MSMHNGNSKDDEYLGKVIFNSLKAQPRDQVWQVNGITGESNTFGDVLSSAVQVANGLNTLKVGVADIVAIVSKYSPNCIASVFGCIFNGSAPFPMDPTMKQLELEHMFKLSKPKVVLVVGEKVAETIAALDAIGHPAPIFVLTGKVADGSRAKSFESLLDSSVGVESYQCRPIPEPRTTIAAVVPSSGTTGLPKGVASSHTSYLIQIKYFARYSLNDVFMQTTPIFWISGFLFSLLSAYMGFKRIYFNDISPEVIIPAFEKHKVVWAMFAPIFMDNILRCPLIDKHDLSSWKQVAIGGSALSSSTAQLLKEKLPHVEAGQGYGATEVTGVITNFLETRDIASAGKIVDFATVKVVDPQTNEELGVGKIGEIQIKTPSMMAKYLLNEENPTSPIDENGFYHTGDLGYVTTDDNIYITGRIKELIKVKNHQVSPVELEDVIKRMKGVSDVAIVGIPHPIDQYHPRALVQKDKDAILSEEQIINEVAGGSASNQIWIVPEKLSETKQLFGGAQFVSSIPRNASGKIKRNQLLDLVKP